MARLRPVEGLLSDFLERMPARERGYFDALGQAAADAGSPLYLVGGSVRDLLLGQQHLDLDFVVEADAPAVATAFRGLTKARLRVHPAFRTAEVAADGFAFDLVTARREVYPAPGALPVVTPSALSDDLVRRDFSVNAIALTLTGPERGRLVDPHRGVADLEEDILRALHDQSFRDDATRLWRAARYAARLDLRFDPATEAAARRDVRYLDAISPARIHHELQQALAEPGPGRAFRTLDELGVLRGTLEGWACTDADAEAIIRLQRGALVSRSDAMLAVSFLDWDDKGIEAAVERLALERGQARALRGLPRLRSSLAGLGSEAARPSDVRVALDQIPDTTCAALAARHPDRWDGRVISRYLSEWRFVRPLLTADDVIALGVPWGPMVGRVLARLTAARLDGETATRADEERLVLEMLSGDGETP